MPGFAAGEIVTATKLNDLSWEVEGFVEVASFSVAATTTTLVTGATVTLTIPAAWGSWRCLGQATFARGYVHNATVAGNLNLAVRIDGTNCQEQQTTRVGLVGTAGNEMFVPGAVGGMRTGLNTTGARTVQLFARVDAGTVVLGDIFLHARAVRTG